MATINITVQSLLNSAQYDSYTVADTTTVGDFKNTIQSQTGVDVAWFDLVFNNQVLNTANTLASYSIINSSQLRTHNKIARLPTLEDRQVAKLQLSQLERIELGNTRPDFDIMELPTRYVGNTVVDNPNPDGLLLGRPWLIPGDSASFTEFFGPPPYVPGNQIEDVTGSFNVPIGFTINDGVGHGSGVAMIALSPATLNFFATSSYNNGYVWTVNWGPGSTYPSTPVALYFELFGPGTCVMWILDPSDPTYSTAVPSGTFNFPATFVEGTISTSFTN